MRMTRVGGYQDMTKSGGNDRGLHLAAVDERGPKRYQSVSESRLSDDELRALRQGQTVEIPWILASDLLLRIAS